MTPSTRAALTARVKIPAPPTAVRLSEAFWYSGIEGNGAADRFGRNARVIDSRDANIGNFRSRRNDAGRADDAHAAALPVRILRVPLIRAMMRSVTRMGCVIVLGGWKRRVAETRLAGRRRTNKAAARESDDRARDDDTKQPHLQRLSRFQRLPQAWNLNLAPAVG